MFLFILGISIITAIAQLISTSYDLKDPLKRGISKITIAGWIFYICTGILMFMPAIQKALQDSIENDREIERTNAQDIRDKKLRNSYDSSLVEMKNKFDSTTIIISETLGKYGYKLDSSNMVLVSIRDSAKTRIITPADPILVLDMSQGQDQGIVFEGKVSDSIYNFRINILSESAGSAYIDIFYDFVVKDSLIFLYSPRLRNRYLELNSRIAKDYVISTPMSLSYKGNIDVLFIWVHGTYKRLDGTGLFPINDVYGYYFQNKVLRIITGESRKTVINMVQAKLSLVAPFK